MATVAGYRMSRIRLGAGAGFRVRIGEYRFPKVLILSLNRVNTADVSSNSLLLKNLFAGWPKERTAQIYSGGSNGDVGHFGAYYEVNKRDRRFGKVFFRMKRREMASFSNSRNARGKALVFSPSQRVKDWGRTVLLRAGVYELIFSLRISQSMRTFIREFSPDVIFAQGYSLGFSWLPVAIQRLTGVPMCFHTSDDWPGNLYRGQPLSWLTRLLVWYRTHKLIKKCSLCFGFSPAMCNAYERRYHKTFHLMMNGDDLGRFRMVHPVAKADPQETRIVYTGSLGHGRGESLIDLCLAVQSLRQMGFKIGVYAYVVNLRSEMALQLGRFDFVRLPDPPRHEELPSHLKAADILFLPESFDAKEARCIAFSISSKAQLYMMSERPVLVYSHPLSGICQYAAQEGWGLVISSRNRTDLSEALVRLMRDEALREKLVKRGIEVARSKHDRKAIAADFEQKLLNLACSELTR